MKAQRPKVIYVVSEGRYSESQIVAAYWNKAEAEAEEARLRDLNKKDKAYGCAVEAVTVK